VRLTVLGSGSAFSNCGCNAGYLVDGRLLVDCGAPVPALLRRAGTSINQLRVVLLTHFHADHSFMLPTVLGARAYADELAPPGLVIGGPVGTREYISRLVAAGYGAYIKRDVEANVVPEYVVLQDGSDVEVGGYRVQSHSVVHSTGPSLAYKVTDQSGASVGTASSAAA